MRAEKWRKEDKSQGSNRAFANEIGPAAHRLNKVLESILRPRAFRENPEKVFCLRSGSDITAKLAPIEIE